MCGDIRIYAACLASYNNGILHGAWVDAAQNEDAIFEAIHEMLKASPEPEAEEFAIHDHEGFEGLRIAEYEGIAEVAEKAAFVSEHGDLGAELVNHYGDIQSALSALEDHYAGEFESVAEFAEQITNETMDIPDNLRIYIDWDRMARDLEINDILAIELGHSRVHIFWSH